MSTNKTLFVRSFKEEKVNDEDPRDDEAVKQAKKIASKSGIPELIWNVGDYCKCRCIKDGLLYEAKIIQIFNGQNTCKVCFIGYENEEIVPLSNLRESGGPRARLYQFKDAELKSSDDEEEMEVASQANHNTAACNTSQQARNKSLNANKNFDLFNNLIQNQIKSEEVVPNLASFMPPMGDFPPHPPPGVFLQDEDSEVVSSMLSSWYMSGYYTGFYHGMKHAKQIKKSDLK